MVPHSSACSLHINKQNTLPTESSLLQCALVPLLRGKFRHHFLCSLYSLDTSTYEPCIQMHEGVVLIDGNQHLVMITDVCGARRLIPAAHSAICHGHRGPGTEAGWQWVAGRGQREERRRGGTLKSSPLFDMKSCGSLQGVSCVCCITSCLLHLDRTFLLCGHDFFIMCPLRFNSVVCMMEFLQIAINQGWKSVPLLISVSVFVFEMQVA